MVAGIVHGSRGSSNPATVSPIPPARQSRVFFEYTGRTGLTVIGPVTGRQYRFGRPGARLEVDLKDRRSLAAVPNLRQITLGLG